MNVESVLRAAQILRMQPACTMSVRSLHARLQGELGPDAGSYAQVYHRLKNLPHSFVVIDAPQFLPGADIWPAQLREEYNSALEGAGLGSCARVALAEVTPDELRGGALGLASRTVAELWSIAQGDPVLREYLSAVAQQLEEISATLSDDEAAHPTIHPRDPRS